VHAVGVLFDALDNGSFANNALKHVANALKLRSCGQIRGRTALPPGESDA
jgi:hypothetical protein